MAGLSSSIVDDRRWRKYLDPRHHEVPLCALQPRTVQTLSEYMDMEVRSLNTSLPSDYRGLAGIVGINFVMVESFGETPEVSPTEKVICEWQNRRNNCRQKPTFGNLVEALLQIERFDALDGCREELATDARAYLVSKADRVLMRPLPHHLQGDWEILTMRDQERGRPAYFDAFIICNWESEYDRTFVKKDLLPRLESSPYNLQFYLPVRDGLFGVNIYKTDADIIQNRCAHVVVILSKEYKDCDQSIFHTSFAIGLSLTDRQQRHIVPIIIEQCEMPEVLSIKAPLDFTKDRDDEKKWRNLAASVSRPSAARDMLDD